MTFDRLGGVHAKLDRARAHLEAFEAAFRGWVDSQADDFAVHLDYSAQRLRLDYPPPSRRTADAWSAIAGDAIHNARSALDHLAWQLVLANGGTPGRPTSFPLLSSHPECNRCHRAGPV